MAVSGVEFLPETALGGVGIDMESISRIEKSISVRRFLERCFSEEEILQLELRGGGRCHPTSAAGMWAAKEAFSKLLGTGVRGFSLKEVSVFHDSKGAPYYRLEGKALEIFSGRFPGLMPILSITHSGDWVTAIAMTCHSITFPKAGLPSESL